MTFSRLIPFGVLLLAAVLRLIGVNAGLPLCRFGDESVMIRHSESVESGDLNPHMFVWGSLPFYVFAGTARCASLFSSDMSYSDHALLFRLVGAAFSVATVAIVMLIGRLIGGRSVALIAGVLFAATSYPVTAAHYATAEPMLGFWAALVVLGIVNLTLDKPYSAPWIGLALGLAIATKYNAVLMATGLAAFVCIREVDAIPGRYWRIRLVGFTSATVALALLFSTCLVFENDLLHKVAGWTTSGKLQPFYAKLAHQALIGGLTISLLGIATAAGSWFRLRVPSYLVRISTNSTLIASGIVAAFTFVMAEPYAVLDFPAFAQGVAYTARKQSLGPSAGFAFGSRSETALAEEVATANPLFYPTTIWEEFGPSCLFLFPAIIVLLKPQNRGFGLPLLAIPLLTLILLVPTRYQGVRYLYPIWPILCVLFARGLWATAERFRGDSHRLRVWAAGLLIAVCLVIPMIGTIRTLKEEFLMPDTRDKALEWTIKSLEKEQVMVRESDTLELEKAGFQVEMNDELFETRSLSDWEREGVHVFILGARRREFYRAHADRFSDVLVEYDRLEKRSAVIHFLADPESKGPQIDVFILR